MLSRNIDACYSTLLDQFLLISLALVFVIQLPFDEIFSS